MGAPVQVTEQVLGGDTVHLNLSEMEQVNGAGQRVGAPVQATEQVKEGDTVHLNPGKWSRSKIGSSSSGDRTGFRRGYR